MTYNWIVAKQDMSMHCSHCGKTLEVGSPVSIEMWVYTSKVFVERHRTCKSSEVR